MKIKISGLALLLFLITACKRDLQEFSDGDVHTGKNDPLLTRSLLAGSPVDSLATTETVNLLNNLFVLADSGIMFGQEDALAKGVGWYEGTDRSDIKSVVGEHPMIFGADMGGYEVAHTLNWDNVNLQKVKFYAIKAYETGGINTFSWHLYNPIDTTLNSKGLIDSTVHKILTDSVIHARYLRWLDRIASFITSIKDSNNTPIPIIFRPFHEHNWDWYWWGRAHCSSADYIQLWRMTVDYLRDTKNVHQLLYAYSPGKFATEAAYLERYPGDDYVDVLGLDVYDKPENHPGTTFITQFAGMIDMLDSMAATKNKVFALTETGFQNLTMADWYTDVLLPVISGNKLSYAMTWRNAGSNYFFVPYPGQASESNFVSFYSDSAIFKRVQLPAGGLYQ